MASIAAIACYRGLRMSRATALARRFRERGPVLCYHNVVADAVAGDPSLHMRVNRFEQQMRWLARHYTVLPLSEYVERLRLGKPLRSTAAVTFDDAYAGVFAHALPVLRALDLPATVFVVTGAAVNAAAFWWDHPAVVSGATPQRREHWLRGLHGDDAAILSEMGVASADSLPPSQRSIGWASLRAQTWPNVEFGAHSETHRFLPALSDAELEDEVCASRDALHRHTGITASLFAYPYGEWNPRVARVVETAGYHAGFGLDPENGAPVTLSAIPRVNIPSGISNAAFEAWLAGWSR